LIFDDLGRLSRVLGEDDDLNVGEIWDRVERRIRDGVDTPGQQAGDTERDEKRILGGAFDDIAEHGFYSSSSAASSFWTAS